MSNEITISITVLTCHQEKARQILDKHVGGTPDDENDFIVNAINGLYYMQYYEMKHRHFTEAMKELTAAGIAWDYDYAGDNDPGESHLRFTETGQCSEKNWSNSRNAIDITELMAVVNNYEQLRDLVIGRQREIAVDGWERQEEYGRRYQAAQLLLPKTST